MKLRIHIISLVHLASLVCGRRKLTPTEHDQSRLQQSWHDSKMIHSGKQSNAADVLAMLLLSPSNAAAGWHIAVHQYKAERRTSAANLARLHLASSRRSHALQMMADEEPIPTIPQFTKVPTPIGPLSPFRSSAVATDTALDQAMFDLVNKKMPAFANDFGRLQLDMQMGNEIDRDRMLKLAEDLSEAELKWRGVMTQMRLATDFQAREYFKLTEAWMARKGENIESMGIMMRWQADNMRAFANNAMPVPPPPGVDLAKLMQQQQDAAASGQQGVMQMVNTAQAVDSAPFTGSEKSFESELVNQEFIALCKDHQELINLGEGYGDFDGIGQITFLLQLKDIHSRWDTFFARFALLGEINPVFEKQTTDWLKAMGMTASVLREVLTEAHDSMRKEAEKDVPQQILDELYR